MIRCDDDEDIIECPPCPSPGGESNGAVVAAVIGALGGIFAASLPSLISLWQARREHQDNLLATAVRAETRAERAEEAEEQPPKPRRRRA